MAKVERVNQNIEKWFGNTRIEVELGQALNHISIFLGSMGENLVGCCLMQGSPVHCKLASRLIEKYPPLVNDIFLSEDYYGLFLWLWN